MENIEPYSKELLKMIFIYNAILNGWSVKFIETNKFEFTSSDNKIRKEFIADNFIKEFIEKNIA